MAMTHSLDVVDVVDVASRAQLSVDQLPSSANLLGCRTCGLPAAEHGLTVIHRFARPDLPTGYGYRDELGGSDELALRRRPAEQSTIVTTGPALLPSGTDPAVDPQERLQHGVNLLPALVDGCHHASITTVSDGRVHVHAATDRTGQRADELQEELDEGPCLQAVRTGHSVLGHDLRTETRWSGWCSTAMSELGVTAVLSVLLVSTLQPLATLNLYSETVGGLSRVDIAQLHTLAGPLADALLDPTAEPGRLGPAA